MSVRHRQDEQLCFETAIDNAKRELAKNVSATPRETNWPTLRCLGYSGDDALEFAFEIERSGRAAFLVPGQ